MKSRILHRALLGDVGSPSRFGLTTGHLINLRTLRIVSLAFSYWLDTVTVADVGYVETGVGSLTPLSTHHIIIQSNSHLGERIVSSWISDFYSILTDLNRVSFTARLRLSVVTTLQPVCTLCSLRKHLLACLCAARKGQRHISKNVGSPFLTGT